MLSQTINKLQKVREFSSSFNALSTSVNEFWSPKPKTSTIESFTEHFLSLLTQSKPKQLTSFLGNSINTDSNHVKALQTLHLRLRRDGLQKFEILVQYKLPFGKIGHEQFMTYVKLSTRNGNRYLALWMGRNLNSRQSWKIHDLYLHQVSSELNLGMREDDQSETQFSTITGKMIDDSTLTSFFFIRLFTDRAQCNRDRRSLRDAEGYQRNLIEMIHGQTEELLNILRNTPTTFSLSVLSPQLRNRIRDLQSSAEEAYPVLEGEGRSDRSLKLLSLTVLPNNSQKQTRLLAHVYMPSHGRYLSVWFKRTFRGDLSWKIDDFYIHQFRQVDHSSYVNQEFCKKTFQTVKSRVFYAADLMGKYIVTQHS